jgi:hypothetical protein
MPYDLPGLGGHNPPDEDISVVDLLFIGGCMGLLVMLCAGVGALAVGITKWLGWV